MVIFKDVILILNNLLLIFKIQNSNLYTQSFAAYKIKPKCLINGLINDLGHLYIIRVSYLQQGERLNTSSPIQIKVKKTTRNAMHFNNHNNDLLQFSFILKALLFSDAYYLEAS